MLTGRLFSALKQLELSNTLQQASISRITILNDNDEVLGEVRSTKNNMFDSMILLAVICVELELCMCGHRWEHDEESHPLTEKRYRYTSMYLDEMEYCNDPGFLGAPPLGSVTKTFDTHDHINSIYRVDARAPVLAEN